MNNLLKNVKSNRKSLIIGIVAVIIAVVLIVVLTGSKNGSSEAIITFSTNRSEANANASMKPIGDGEYTIDEAVEHIGEKATVVGKVDKVFTSKSGTVFFDFCDNFQTCPFSAVIFAKDVEKFKDLSQYEREVRLTGIIKSYQGKAEMVLNGPEQIK